MLFETSHIRDYNAGMARLQISLGRMLVSVTLLAVAFGLGSLTIRISPSSQAVGNTMLSIAWCLFFAGIGNVFNRVLWFVLIGILILIPLVIPRVHS
jgi:hypothetical protein